jgi:hypothetical protein
MKSLHNIAVNYGKVLKSCEQDINEEHIYAEINIICSEPKYVLSENGTAKKTIEISDFEIGVNKQGAKRLIQIFKDIHSKLDKLEKEQL